MTSTAKEKRPQQKKPKEHKTFTVSGYFPDLASGKAYQNWTGRATNIGMAAYIALKEIRKRPGVAKKRIHTVRLSVLEVQNISGLSEDWKETGVLK